MSGGAGPGRIFARFLVALAVSYRALKPVFFGGAAVGAFHGDDAAGDFDSARKMGEGAPVLIDRREIDVESGDVFDIAVVEFL